ncbi:viperin family antiviral radical SAM protein, partial [Leucothrix pacifica]
MRHLPRLVQAVDQLVINWHATEVCNYRCDYCYAKWSDKQDLREIIHDPYKSKLLLKKLYQYFQPNNIQNPLSNVLRWKSVRLNIAGGEPTLYKEKLIYILEQARSVGFDTSIITNGSASSDLSFMHTLSNLVSMIGISIDSSSQEDNTVIGRENKRGEQLGVDDLVKALAVARSVNPDIVVKLNSVINHVNYLSDMNDMVRKLQPNKWKVLRVLPVITNALSITDQEFRGFVERHSSLSECMVVEDNQDMTESYIMVDPPLCQDSCRLYLLKDSG